ncbi:hypothetical protein IZY60_10575 [Lutibacter sp. B2]|nr:hypothetical protein [Lutibacter sp. B2]
MSLKPRFLKLEQQYNIYSDYDEIEMKEKSRNVNFYLKGTNKIVGAEYPIKTDENKNKVLKSGYIRIRSLLENLLITQEKHDELMDKASHSSDKSGQKNSKGCISTYDLLEEEFRELIELNIKLLKIKLSK